MMPTPDVPAVKQGTAVFSTPAAEARPAPTQPETDPDSAATEPQAPPPTDREMGEVSATLPPDESTLDQPGGRTGTVLGDGMSPGLADTDVDAGDYGPTAEMPPTPFGNAAPPPAYALPPNTQNKRKNSSWTIMAIIGVIFGLVAAAAVVGYFVVIDEDGTDPPSASPIFSPPATVTADYTTTTTTTSTETTPTISPTTPPPSSMPTATNTNTHRPPRDAGALEAGLPGFPDAAFPLPPIPSGIIPPIVIPSGFPTITLPGWPPAPPPPNQ